MGDYELMGRVVAAVVAERTRQLAKWGDQNHKGPLVWLAIIGEEYGEVSKAILENGPEYETELIHVAACAIAAIEAHRVQRLTGAEGARVS